MRRRPRQSCRRTWSTPPTRPRKATTRHLPSSSKGLQSLGATQKKTADESVKHSKAMSDATESVAQTGEKALRTFGALFLLFAGAHSVKSFVSDMLNLDAATGRLAHNTGSTTEVISGIGRAAERAGGSFEGAVGGLRSLSDAYQQLRTTGQSGVMEPLARLQGSERKKDRLRIGRSQEPPQHRRCLAGARQARSGTGRLPRSADPR